MSIPRPGAQSGLPLAILCGMAFSSLIADLHWKLEEAGYGDLRPAHGFIFQNVAAGGATAAMIAAHLGITRQSTQQILDDLEAVDYVRRVANPDDRRSKKIVLTDRGVACLFVVEETFRALDALWRNELGGETLSKMKQGLAEIAEKGNVRGPLRPVW